MEDYEQISSWKTEAYKNQRKQEIADNKKKEKDSYEKEHGVPFKDLDPLKQYYYPNGHIAFREDKEQCVGTEKFMSIAANSGNEQGRKDDLESFGYVLVELGTERKLPWEDYPGIHKDKGKQRFEKKLGIRQNVKVEDLC